MKKFTKFLLFMMAILWSSSLVIAQVDSPITVSNPDVETTQDGGLDLQKAQHRLPLQPGAQTQPAPEDRRTGKTLKTFTVTGDGSRATTDIRLQLTVDYFYTEASYNLWSNDAGAYYWTTDQTFTSAYQVKTHILSLEVGSTYNVECYDDWGDGGIAGNV